MWFSVADTYSSYNELVGRVKSFEETTYSQLVHRDSWTLEAAAKRVPKKVEKANKELVYYTINLCSKVASQSSYVLTFPVAWLWSKLISVTIRL